MTKYSLLLAALALCGLAAPAWAQPTVTNGDFETGVDMFNTFPGYLGQAGNPTEISGWDSHTGNVGVNPLAMSGDPCGPFRDNGANSTHAGFIQVTAAVDSSLTQAISGFTVGKTYKLDFDYNARDCCGDVPALEVTLGMGDFTDPMVVGVDPPGVRVTPWYHGSLKVVADATILVLVIHPTSVGGGDATLLIDNLVLTSLDDGS